MTAKTIKNGTGAVTLSLVLIFSVFAGTLIAGGVASAAPTQNDVSSLTDNADSVVTIRNQTSGGSTVVIDSVNLPEGGFVAIHDATLNDGEVLKSVRGASKYLEPGSYENVRIELDEPLEGDATLVAMPHKDTDADRKYEFVSGNAKVDGPYTSGGEIVIDTARIKVSATIEFSDQPTDGRSILIDSVELSEPGFIAVHDSTLLDGKVLESVVGHSEYLEAGSHENVRIELDTTLTEDQTLIPMPHKDTNANQAYDFVTSEGNNDGPFINNEAKPVVDTGKSMPSTEATARFNEQSSGGNWVTVEEVFVPDGGFVTMHDATLNDGKVFDSVRGTSEYLAPGLHRNVKIRLDKPLQGDGTLVAMPHKDTNANQAYDFVTSEGNNDGPYTSGGDIVVDTGKVKYSASIEFESQKSDGRTIVIDSVDLSEGGFIAVHDSTLLNGKVLKSVVGHSEYLEAGHHTDVEITLDRRLNETQTLIPMPHKDTNANQEYEFVTQQGDADGPYIYQGGAVIDPAQVTIQSSIEFVDQKSQDGTVVVDSVTLSNGGFVVIHDSSLLDGKVLESVIGVSDYLGPGTHTNVEISLDEPVAEGDTVTLISMPHRDTNANQEYDFVEDEGSADGPYVAGNVVVNPAKVMGGEMEEDEMDNEEDNDDMEEDGMDEGSDGMDNEEDNDDMEEDGMDEGSDDADQEMDDENMSDSDGESSNDGGSGANSLPGFGIAVAVLVLVSIGAISLRRD